MHLNDGTITSRPALTSTVWDGGVCPTCATRYLGSHACTREDIVRKIGELARLLDVMPVQPVQVDQTRSCPCRPENGGSGVCGCILGGPRITCSA